MKILSNIQPLTPSIDVTVGANNTKTDDVFGSFKDVLSEALNKVNSLQNNAEDLRTKLATGEVNDIHTVMIASEKASLAFQLTTQVRNKLVDAYQEIMRMQV